MCYRVLSILASAILAASQTVDKRPITGSSFYLQVLSPNTTLNNTSLFACHEGAAIEGLCWSTTPISKYVIPPAFTFNASRYNPPYGDLLYNFTYGNGMLWEPLSLTFNLVSNIAVPWFTPSEQIGGGSFGFDNSDLLMIGIYNDDSNATTVFRPDGQPTPYYRWYICSTYAGYAYTTLAWGLGISPPQNPTCQAVNIRRVYPTPPVASSAAAALLRSAPTAFTSLGTMQFEDLEVFCASTTSASPDVAKPEDINNKFD